jgi:CRISPR-associated protein Csm3
MEVKLNKVIPFNGKLKVLESGLRIGGSSGVAGIGEMDNPIIRNPITRRPYVPGSSVKGKVRTLLELRDKQYSSRGGPCDCGTCNVCKMFGCGFIKNADSPTRVIFRDSQPDAETVALWEKQGVDAEEKTEVTINRKNLSANPREMERIPADSSFDFSFSFRVFEGDDSRALLDFLADGFELLGQDYLGGSGSRGYGHVAIVAEDGTPMHEYLRQFKV